MLLCYDAGIKIDEHLRSVERGVEILPPFETPVGRVGLAICFDVSWSGF